MKYTFLLSQASCAKNKHEKSGDGWLVIENKNIKTGHTPAQCRNHTS